MDRFRADGRGKREAFDPLSVIAEFSRARFASGSFPRPMRRVDMELLDMEMRSLARLAAECSPGVDEDVLRSILARMDEIDGLVAQALGAGKAGEFGR